MITSILNALVWSSVIITGALMSDSMRTMFDKVDVYQLWLISYDSYNDSDLKGIDKDKNGIRDDVDGFIQFMDYGYDAEKFAKNFELVLSKDFNGIDEKRSFAAELTALSICENREWKSSEFRRVIFNTPERMAKLDEFLNPLLNESFGDNYMQEVMRICKKRLR